MRIKNVLEYLDGIVKVKPDKTAFSDGENSLSFEDVYSVSCSVGTYLAHKDIYNRPIAVFMRKSPAEIAAFLGIVRAGDYYVPIDDEMPAARIQLILDNINTPVIICDKETYEYAGGFKCDAELVLYDEISGTAADVMLLSDIRRRSLDTDPIYIVFTSGSTGIPKGVAACHRSVIDYIEELSDILEFDEDTVFGNQSPLYFDACLKEIYPTLKFGATTYLIPKTDFSLPVMLIEYLNKYQINTICWVVSALTMVSAFGTFETVKPEYLKRIAFGSEVFPPKQLRIWREAAPEATFTNLYGPTETTGMCCFYRVNKDFADDEVIPVGRPFPNREIILLKDDNTRASAGEEGEICIRGNALTLGYYNDPERTDAAFVQNPFNTSYREYIYKTGDIGRLGDDGNLYFVSRKDYQIKHMGHRIELGEIECTVNMFDEVQMSACIYDDVKKKIRLYYVGDMSESDMLAELKTRLPRYMQPAKMIKLDKLPFTANGKIDRRALKTL